MKTKSIKKQKLTAAIITTVLVLFLVVIVGFPLLWMAISSFKPATELFTIPPKVFPQDWSFEWYKQAFQNENVIHYFWNSIYIADGKAEALWEQQKHTAQYYDVSTTEYVAAEDAVYTTVFVPYVYSEAVAEEMWKIFTADGIEEGLVSEVNYSSAFISNLRTVDTTVKQLSKTFLIVGLILAVFAVLLFSNFISASISQKTRDIGILRAVGARGTDVFRIFFSESFVIVLICAALSIAASYVVCGVIDAQLNEGIGATILSFGVMSVAVLLVSAFFTALISTFLPVYNAARKKPVESIRSL